MHRCWLAVTLLLASAPVLAATCPSVEAGLLDKGFSSVAPWRVVSGGPGECSFSTRSSSVNFGFNHAASPSVEAATAAAVEMRDAVAPKSVVEPMPILGTNGIMYQPKNDKGQVDQTSMFFYGHSGTINVSGYLNLKDPITQEQRDLAAGLIAASMARTNSPKTLAKISTCKYTDAALLARLLPGSDLTYIVPDANNCVMSAGGRIVTVAVAKDSRGWNGAEQFLKEGGCTVDRLPGLGKAAGIAHHCTKGNPRAEVAVVTNGRVLRVLYAPPAEPSAEDRTALVELAKYAAAK